MYLLSFNLANVKINEIEYWLKLIKTTIKTPANIMLFMVGTHSDEISENEQTNILDLLKSKFKKQIFPFIVEFISLSCKTGNGIKYLIKKMKDLTQSMLNSATSSLSSSSGTSSSLSNSQNLSNSLNMSCNDSTTNLFSTQLDVPPTWSQIKSKIRLLRLSGKKYLLINEYIQLLDSVLSPSSPTTSTTTPLSPLLSPSSSGHAGSSNTLLPAIELSNEYKILTNYLHNIGYLIYFNKIPMIFLDINLIYEIYSRISSTKNERKSGLYSKNDIKEIFSSYDESIHPIMTDLFQRYKLIYYVKQRNKYFIPCTLSKNNPSGGSGSASTSSLSSTLSSSAHVLKLFPSRLPDDQACFGRVFQFQQHPTDLISLFLCSILNTRGLKEEIIWNNGIICSFNDKIYITTEFIPNSNKVLLEFRFLRTGYGGEYQNVEKQALGLWRQLLETIRTHIESLCSGMKWEELIPCIHCIRRGIFRDKIYLIPYQSIIDNPDEPFIYCNNIQSPSRCISRTEVAPDITLRDLPQVSRKQLQHDKQIGEGGFGVVYKGILSY